MDWKSPFVVYRLTPEGKLQQVYCAKDLNAARYWLTYVAEVGDICCRTPAHPKHSGQSPRPEYWGHKEKSGKASADEPQWQEWARSRNFDLEFPEQQASEQG